VSNKVSPFETDEPDAEKLSVSALSLFSASSKEILVRVEYNLAKALQWCDVANILRIQLERQNQVLFSSLREYNLAYGVNKKLLDSLNKEIIILHPGPINRGVEIDSDVADSKQSIILQQVENGVAVRMAVLYLLSNKQNFA
jgi:aspartate carbamoyltransferase catalytic subunit